MNNLSAVILTRNEEKNIERCIRSVLFCEEIIILDDYSEDKTLAITRQFSLKIIKRKLDEDFSSQRNFGLEKALGKWVLFIDADEEVSKDLKNEIIQAVANPFNQHKGYLLRRQDVLWGKKLHFTEAGRSKILRLAKKGSGLWKRKIHEYWQAEGRVGELKNFLWHYPHQNLREFISDINNFSNLHALANQKEGKKSGLFKIIFWPVGKFLKNWLFNFGFLEGERGFMVAFLMSLHSFLAWSKLWIIEQKTK